MEAPLDAEFSLIRQHRADAGLGWLMTSPEALPSPLDAMSLCESGPDAWIPALHAAAHNGTISLDELTRMDVDHGPRRTAGTCDAWTRVVRTVDPRFEFTDPPLRHSLPVDLALAATADRPTAVLTGPSVIAGSHPGLPRPMVAHDMVRVGPEDHPLAATAVLVWNGDLPRPLQQILFDAADSIAPADPAWASSTGARVKELDDPTAVTAAAGPGPVFQRATAQFLRSGTLSPTRLSGRSPPRRARLHRLVRK